MPRTQSSIAVSAGDGRWFVLNASPDLRQQINQLAALHPAEGRRHSPIAGVVLTNADIDHVAGLLTLRESQPLAVYGSRRVLGTLAANSVFNVLNRDLVLRHELEMEGETELRDPNGRAVGIAVEAFPVPGKVALYLEDPTAGSDFGTVAEDTIGLRVTERSTGRAFFYIPGCASMPDGLARRLDGAPLVLFDGTTWIDDEMRATGVGEKTGRRMGHMSMNGAAGSIAAFAPLAVERKVFIHINNTNPALLSDSPERAEAEAAGWEIAYDGMEIAL